MTEGTAPLVAVVIPVYNTPARYLREAVASAAAQTYSPLEVVITDDGSTSPETLSALVDLCADSTGRVRVLTQDNAGAGEARNTAISATQATYILPLDADDWMEPGYVAAAVERMESDPELGIVYCPALLAGALSGVWQTAPYSVREMTIGNPIPPWGLYRREDWEAVGGYGLRILEDYDFWLSIIELGRGVAMLEEPLYHYRQHAAQTTADIDDAQAAGYFAAVMRRHPDFFLKNAEHLFVELRRRQRRIEFWQGRYGRFEDARHRLGGTVKNLRRQSKESGR